MTAKRFKFICDDENCFFKDRNKALYCYEVVDLLNSLSNENEQLKKELDQFYLLIGRGDWSGLVDLIKGDRNDCETIYN